MHLFTINTIENLTGIKAHTIRIWEQRYTFLNPSRSNTNIRFYSIDELQLLLNISLLNRYGYKISSIAEMSAEQMQQSIEQLHDLAAHNENLVNKLFIQMAMLDIDLFEQSLQAYALHHGIDVCIDNIILSLSEKINTLCDKHSLHKAQEHLMFSILRKKIIAGILLLGNSEMHAKTVLMFLPEGDYYETELLLMQYSIKRQGLHVIYLGTNVPLKDVVQIASYKKPDFVYTMLSKEFTHLKAAKYLEKLSLLFCEYKIIVTGKPLQLFEKHVPENIQLNSSTVEVIKSFQ